MASEVLFTDTVYSGIFSRCFFIFPVLRQLCEWVCVNENDGIFREKHC